MYFTVKNKKKLPCDYITNNINVIIINIFNC